MVLPSVRRSVVVQATLLALAAGLAAPAVAQDPNACDEPGEAPDVIIGDLDDVARWGSNGGITAFTISTVSCNLGSCWANWFGDTADHPLIAQNLYRLKDGRFEQIGQSWVKHTHFATSETFCSNDCVETDGSHLGVNCSDPYGVGVNANQLRLGPKFEVNPSTGVFPYPATDQDQTGDSIYKRLQVHNSDLDPALNLGASYYIEGQYVAADDAATGNQHNNASHRRVLASGVGSFFDLQLDYTAVTQREDPAILAWRAVDSQVQIVIVDAPADGRFIAAARATDLGGGQWHYEYAIHNLNSHRAARSFRVPLSSAGLVSNVGFHDVDYHSGEPVDGTDWSATVGPGSIEWTTQTFVQNPDANALRWGTLYNFRFDASAAPTLRSVTLGLFRPGSPAEVAWLALAPIACDAVGDSDGDGVGACDCDDTNPDVWSTPGEARDLVLDHAMPDGTALSWSEPSETGGASLSYGVLRAESPHDFVNATVCIAVQGMQTSTSDSAVPQTNSAFHYLVRAANACPDGQGPLGHTSGGEPRQGMTCP